MLPDSLRGNNGEAQRASKPAPAPTPPSTTSLKPLPPPKPPNLVLTRPSLSLQNSTGIEAWAALLTALPPARRPIENTLLLPTPIDPPLTALWVMRRVLLSCPTVLLLVLFLAVVPASLSASPLCLVPSPLPSSLPFVSLILSSLYFIHSSFALSSAPLPSSWLPHPTSSFPFPSSLLLCSSLLSLVS